MMSLSQRFLNNVQFVIQSHLNETTFSVSDLSRYLGISEPTLRRKVKQVTGLSPKLYIRQLRLKKATELLEINAASVSEIARIVGFSDPAYFSKCFHEQYGIVPSLYRGKQSDKKKFISAQL